MQARVTIHMNVEELDLLRRALATHMSMESELVNDKSAKSSDDMKRKAFARSEIVQTQDLLLKLGIRGGKG